MKPEIQILPYLTFDGTCQKAMEFYHGIFGGQLTINLFADVYGEMPEADKHKVMHAALENEFVSLFANDTVPGSTTTFGDNVRVTLTGSDGARLAPFFEKLAGEGTVLMPFEKQVWGQELGMLTDKFGTHWLVSVGA